MHKDSTSSPCMCLYSTFLILLFFFLPSFVSVVHAHQKLQSIDNIQLSIHDGSCTLTVFTNTPVHCKAQALAAIPSKKIPFRVYLDVYSCSKGDAQVPSPVPHNNLIAGIRIGQRNPTTARLVVDLKKPIRQEEFNVEKFNGPPRIQLTIRSRFLEQPPAISKPVSDSPPLDHKGRVTKKHISEPSADKTQKASSPEPSRAKPPSSLKTQAMHDDRCLTVVIDPGHGGKDPGAVGYKGLLEKDVSLTLARALKKALQTDDRYRVILTREGDTFLSLQERGAIANMHNADLFVSIHANSHRDASLSGLETYYLNFSSDKTARRVAARENFTTPEKIGDLEMILFDLLHSEKINHSSIFAGHVHNALIKNLNNTYGSVRNLGVKHAPMSVLIETDMPGVLIETAFISNPTEAKRLRNKSFHRTVARSICEGIHEYHSSMQTASYRSVD